MIDDHINMLCDIDMTQGDGRNAGAIEIRSNTTMVGATRPHGTHMLDHACVGAAPYCDLFSTVWLQKHVSLGACANLD